MPELFSLNDDMLVDINKEWISTIPEFRRILQRDQGSPGDSQGRKKQHARKEFTLIYHLCDYRSTYENFSSSERQREALRNAELPPDYDIDPELQAAIDRYHDLRDTESIRIARTLKQSMVVSRRVTESLIDRMERYIIAISEDDHQEEGTLIQLGDGLIDTFTKLNKLIKDLPSLTRTITDLETTIKAEMQSEGALRAGAQKGVEEDP